MKKVLVIEDQKTMATLWKVKFDRLGYDVHLIYDGQEAMDAMTRTRFDAILLDLKLPHMNGLQLLAERGKTLNADTPVYVVTNSINDDEIDQAKALGATDTFLKYRTSANAVVQTVQTAVGA